MCWIRECSVVVVVQFFELILAHFLALLECSVRMPACQVQVLGWPGHGAKTGCPVLSHTTWTPCIEADRTGLQVAAANSTYFAGSSKTRITTCASSRPTEFTGFDSISVGRSRSVYFTSRPRRRTQECLGLVPSRTSYSSPFRVVLQLV